MTDRYLGFSQLFYYYKHCCYGHEHMYAHVSFVSILLDIYHRGDCGKVKVKVTQPCPTLYSPWNSAGQNTSVDSLSLLQGIFPTQELNRGLLRYRQIPYQQSHKGSPRILEWVAYPFSSGSSQPRNRTRVSCIAGRFFTNSTIRESTCSIGDPQMLILYFLPLDAVPKPRQRH